MNATARQLAGLIGLLALLVPAPAATAQPKTVTVFAAASLASALGDVHASFTAKTGIKVVASFAASSALIRQIEAGAPADVFASADAAWTEHGFERRLLRPETRVNLLGNRLVLIAPKDSPLREVAIGPGFDLAALAGDGRIATGDVRAVPVGRYAKAALQALGAWAKAEPKLALADHVRAALVLVARGEATLGIVYATDARAEPGVKVIGTFPAGSHPPIVYPFAATRGSKESAADYLRHLRSRDAKTAFERHGFRYLAGPADAS